MSNVSMKNDAGAAALTAIEDALNLASQEIPAQQAVTEMEAPKKRLKIEKPTPVDDDMFADTPVVPMQNEQPIYAPTIRAANDEKSDLGQLLYTLGKKPSNMPMWVAAIFSAFWVTVAALVATSSGLFATGIGSLSAIALVLGPVSLIFGFAYMMIRANEMRLVARGMTEVAMRLAEPENVARDAVASVGQAVRREVEAMNAGVTQTLRHATELEARVSNEVKMIETAFVSNETRIRELVNELAAHRSSISTHATEAQSVLSHAQSGLISALESTQNDLISRLSHHNTSLSDNLTEATNRVLGEFQGKSQTIGDNLLQAGNSVMDTIHMRSTDIMDRLAATGDNVAGTIKTSSDTIITVIAREVGEIRTGLDQAANALTSSLTEHSDAMTMSLHSIGSEVSSALAQTGAEVTNSISSRAAEVNQTLKHTGDSLVLDLGLRGSEVTQKLDETGTRIAEYITDRGNALADRIGETGNRLYETVNVYGADLDKRLAATGAHIAEALQSRTNEAQKTISDVGLHVVDALTEKASHVQSALHQAGSDVTNTMNERGNAFKADLQHVGYGLIEQFASRSNELTDRFSLLSGDFNSKFSDDSAKLEAIAQKMGLSVADISKIMDSHVKGFESLSGRLSMDVALKLTEVSSGMAEHIRGELTHFDQTVSARTTEVASTLDERIGRLDRSLATGASDLSRSLAERAVEIATSLSNGGASVTAIMEEKSNEMSANLIKRVETINETMGARALEVASALDASVGRIGQVSDHISSKTGELAMLFDEKGSKFLSTLSQKSDHISSQITHISDIAVNSLEQRGAAIADAIGIKTTEMNAAMKLSAADMAAQVGASTDTAMAAIASTQDRISAHVGPLLTSLTNTNETLNILANSAQTNLMMMDEHLGKRVNDLQRVVDNVTYAAETGVAGLDKQVIALQAVSGGTLLTLSDLTTRVEKQTNDLHTLNTFFDGVQQNFSNIIDERRAKLDSLVTHLDDRGQNLEDMLTRFNGNMGKSLTDINILIGDQLEEAQKQSHALMQLLSLAGKEQSSSLANHVSTLTTQSNEMMSFITKLEKDQADRLAEQVAGLKATYSQERQVSEQQIQKAYDTTLQNIDALYIDSSSKFNELTTSLRSVSNEIGRELEATRAELKRGLIDMPRETQEHAGSMRRVVADQMKALSELNDIVSKSGRSFDVAHATPRYAMPLKTAEPVRSERFVEPPPPAYDPPPPRRVEPAPAPVVKKKEGWLSDIIARASDDEQDVRREPSFSARNSDTTMIDQLPENIARYIDHDAALDLWERYRKGERKVFNRRIYTGEGQKAFDDIRARYARSEEFRSITDKFIDEFERMLTDVNRTSRDPAVTRNTLVSDTGKTYTILAHASGRFDG